MLDLDSIRFIGSGLVRPECVLVTKTGNTYVSDFRGGVTCIANNGRQQFYGGEVPGLGRLQPNGIALLVDGSFLIAHLGADTGGIYRVFRDNRVTPFVTEVASEPLPPSNFVYLDHQGRIWITVSTRHLPRAAAYRCDIKDGFIALYHDGVARIVADGLGYTNEVFVTPDGKQLYVNATFTRELIRYDIGADKLSNPERITCFGKGIFPDGLTMDTEGYLWVTSIVSNSVVRVNPADGSYEIKLQDVDQAHLEWVEAAYRTHGIGRPHLDNVKSEKLNNISSLAFGGENVSTIYLGCLLGDQLAVCESGHTGIIPAHWEFDG